MTDAHPAKFFRFGVATAVFVLLLFALYYVHMRYFSVDVVFYSALLDAGIAALIAVVLVAASPFFAHFNRFEKTQMALIWLLLGYGYAISIPTVIDRSLSFYLLEKIQQRGGAIALPRFEKIVTEEYPREHHLVDVRLTEQRASGTITIVDGCVRLTARGDRLAHFSRFFRRNLLPRRRLLMGQYSDALVDPFLHSEPATQVGCRQ